MLPRLLYSDSPLLLGRLRKKRKREEQKGARKGKQSKIEHQSSKQEAQMNKVYPDQEPTSSPCTSNGPKTYTLWMKSLVLNSNGCTVYDSNGLIVYRVDNYDTKGSRDVNLLDLRGKVLSTIHKRLLAFGRWDVYRGSDNSKCEIQEKPWFQVKRCYKMNTGKLRCQISTVECQKYCIEKIGGKTAFQIVNVDDGDIVAHAKQKHSSSGVVLGSDVLTLDVEGGIDHSLVMAFVIVFGLICGRMPELSCHQVDPDPDPNSPQNKQTSSAEEE
ncbi:unnamed protein product [Sphenostylis stenocarpa]|uniref:Protein LURP-one-related 4 n=1 Tax=Sphenostylis stenocarpa TaxID=92480 RepID=A0AA86RT24_9FABA|nr:unnamed protein product [Sphenostylis stenocarpa]